MSRTKLTHRQQCHQTGKNVTRHYTAAKQLTLVARYFQYQARQREKTPLKETVTAIECCDKTTKTADSYY